MATPANTLYFAFRYKPLKPDDAEASPTTPSPSTPATSTTNDNIESETATKQPSNEASVITETINHPDASTENETGADVDTLEIQEGTNDNATSDETVPSIEKMIWEQALDLKKSRDLDDDLYELYVENEIRLSPSGNDVKVTQQLVKTPNCSRVWNTHPCCSKTPG